ncbi:MAG: S8 family peptidase [Halothiobacillaceae bacterium]
MKRFSLAASLVAAGLIPPAPAAFPAEEAPVTQLIVQPSSFHAAHASHLDAAAMAPFIQAAGVVMEHVRPLPGQAQVLRLPHPMRPDEARAYAARLVAAGVARMAEPDLRVYPSLVPNDPRFPEQWHVHPLVTGLPYGQNNYGLNLPEAWDRVGRSINEVIVALIDTGLLPHADIDPGRILPGYDFISGLDTNGDGTEDDFFTANDGNGRDADPTDPGDWVSVADRRLHPECPLADSSWHGTFMAGMIAATTDNALGVAGIHGQARLLPLRVLGKCGGQLSDIIDALYWSVGLAVPNVPANPHPAQVINLSLGGGPGPCSVSLQQAIDAALARGATLVVASGNEAGNVAQRYPANCQGVIAVAATDQQGQQASYTNTGRLVTLSAPGGDRQVDGMILSTSNSGATAPVEDSYSYAAGTSMAAAHVSGVVALMYAVNPLLKADTVRAALRATATPFPSYGSPWDCTAERCGAGIVRADWAVLAAQGADFVPDALSFAAQDNVALGVTVTSQPVIIRGLSHATSISIQNGEYSLGCTPSFTRNPGEVEDGQSVCVRHTSAVTYSTSVTSTLTVGGVSANFTSTTQAMPTPVPATGGGGALGAWALLGLAGLALGRHIRARA